MRNTLKKWHGAPLTISSFRPAKKIKEQFMTKNGTPAEFDSAQKGGPIVQGAPSLRAFKIEKSLVMTSRSTCEICHLY